MATTFTNHVQRVHLQAEKATSSAAPHPQGLRMNTLILSHDDEAVRSFFPVLASTGSRAQLCQDAERAMEMVASTRFDAIVVDCDDVRGSMDVLQYLRQSPSNRTSVAFALVSSTAASVAFAAGATFVLNKPVTREQVRSILRAARGVMILGSRRYYRRPLVTPATYVTAAREAIQVWTVNISEGGLKITGPRVPAPGERGTITLNLPDTQAAIIAGVEVVWTKPQEAGLRFTNLVDGGRTVLSEWISKSFELELAAMKPLAQNC